MTSCTTIFQSFSPCSAHISKANHLNYAVNVGADNTTYAPTINYVQFRNSVGKAYFERYNVSSVRWKLSVRSNHKRGAEYGIGLPSKRKLLGVDGYWWLSAKCNQHLRTDIVRIQTPIAGRQAEGKKLSEGYIGRWTVKKKMKGIT